MTAARTRTYNPDSSPRTRRTRQRRAVEDVLAALAGFRTAQQVHDKLTRRDARVGLATVYRTLQAMAHVGEVDAIRTEDGEAAYRRCSGGHHHHMVCRRCGRTVEVIGAAVEQWAVAVAAVEQWAVAVAASHGFRDLSHDLELFGTCSRCRAIPAATVPPTPTP